MPWMFGFDQLTPEPESVCVSGNVVDSTLAVGDEAIEQAVDGFVRQVGLEVAVFQPEMAGESRVRSVRRWSGRISEDSQAPRDRTQSCRSLEQTQYRAGIQTTGQRDRPSRISHPGGADRMLQGVRQASLMFLV